MSHFSIFLLFLRFGFLAWGGPVAQISMIREELVDKQKWIGKEKFNRVLAVYQALPGPEAHELCVYFGMTRKGRWGGFLAGLGFMLPGFVLILLMAYLYKTFGSNVLLPFFIGITPAVTALILKATHTIGGHILIKPSLWLAALLAVILTILGVNFVWIFIICGLWQTLWEWEHKKIALGFLLFSATLSWTLHSYAPDVALSLGFGSGLFIEGLKAGLLSFGGAYTAIPFLKESMVDIYPNITEQSFLDGIAMSNIIPAPLVIFGTFLGFMADGFYGAVLMTLGIFIPAFAFTLVGHNWLEKIIDNSALSGLLNGIAAAVIGLLAVTSVQIFIHNINNPMSLVVFVIALLGFYLIKVKLAVPLVILGCGILGFFFVRITVF